MLMSIYGWKRFLN